MKEIPILFKTEMVQAILAENKTMTRRVVKNTFSPYTKKVKRIHPFEEVFMPYDEFERFTGTGIKCPYGKIGDVLWVRETWQHTKCLNINSEDENYGFVYKADGQPWEDYEYWTWKPSIFMPKAAARIFLEITDIRVERLNEICINDCMDEGIEHDVIDQTVMWKDYINNDWFQDWSEDLPNFSSNLVIESFKSLWESINGEGSFDERWVWVVCFKRINKLNK